MAHSVGVNARGISPIETQMVSTRARGGLAQQVLELDKDVAVRPDPTCRNLGRSNTLLGTTALGFLDTQSKARQPWTLHEISKKASKKT